MQTKLITSMFYRVNIQWLTPWLMRNRSNPNSTCKHNPNHTKTWSVIIYLLYCWRKHSIPFHSIILQSGERAGTVGLHLLRNNVHVKLQRIGGMLLEPQRHQSVQVSVYQWRRPWGFESFRSKHTNNIISMVLTYFYII